VVNLSQKNYRKLEDIINEADSVLHLHSNIKQTPVGNQHFPLFQESSPSANSSSSSSCSPILLNENENTSANKQSSSPSSISTCPSYGNKISTSSITLATQKCQSTFESQANRFQANQINVYKQESFLVDRQACLMQTTDVANVKVDDSSCVLPSKLKQQRPKSSVEANFLAPKSFEASGKTAFGSSLVVKPNPVSTVSYAQNKSTNSNKTTEFKSGFVKSAVAFTNGSFAGAVPVSNGVNPGLAKRFLALIF
jgi:hypothetical protein